MTIRAILALLLATATGACTLTGRGEGDASLVGQDSEDKRGLFTMVPESEKPLAKAKLYFKNGDYGLSEKYFRESVEADPNQTVGWLGLAASYDRLRRFDLAARAYKVVVKQAGYTASVHNNLGYHHYLQGDIAKARKHYKSALAKDPGNPWALNNLEKLDAPKT